MTRVAKWQGEWASLSDLLRKVSSKHILVYKIHRHLVKPAAHARDINRAESYSILPVNRSIKDWGIIVSTRIWGLFIRAEISRVLGPVYTSSGWLPTRGDMPTRVNPRSTNQLLLAFTRQPGELFYTLPPRGSLLKMRIDPGWRGPKAENCMCINLHVKLGWPKKYKM